MGSVNILIGGDVCPVNRYQDAFLQGGQQELLGPVAAAAQRADLFVANLECPLIHRPSPILKTGPVLGVPAPCVVGLRSMGLHAVGLANNHIMDHGPEGLASTLEACAANGVATFGAGSSLESASRILLQDVKGMRVGLLAMAEREWSLATPSAPGANPLDLIAFVRQMKVVRKGLDFLVVLLHAGCEGYELPSPGLRKVCRFLVEEGADVVTCQHSHCVGSYEIHQDRLIVYGQGNFIFDYGSHGPKGKEGVLLSLALGEDGKTSHEFLPFVQGDARPGLAAMAPAEEAGFLEGLESRSRSISLEGHVEACWQAYCETRASNLLDEVLGHGRILRRLNQNGAIVKWRGKPYLTRLLSIVQNESGVEILNTLLRSRLQ